MSDLSVDLLEAIPAYARRIRIIGEDLLRHRALWETRNPLAILETAPGAEAADAVLLSLDELGGGAAEAIAAEADRLAPGGTLALFAAAYDRIAALPLLSTLLEQRGLRVERLIGGQSPGTPGILRFHRPDGPLRQLRVSGYPFNFDADPMRQSVVRVRLREPLQQLHSFPGVRCDVKSRHAIQPVTEPEAGNILIFQRFFFNDAAAVREATRGQNYLTIGEFDDEPGRFEQIPPERIRANLIRHHAIQVASPELAEQLRPYNPEVAVFGNHLPRIRPHRPRAAGETVRILFAAVNREAGWREILQAYRAAAQRYGDKVKTVVVGDRKFFDELQPLNSEFLPTLAHPLYVEELEKSDIALLPLSNAPFDRKKTDLKFIECAEAGAVVVASNTLYAATVKPGKTGFLHRNADEFRRHLQNLIDDPAKRASVAEQAHRYVREQRALANQVRRQYEWYLSLIDRHAELEQAVQRRIG